MLQALISPLLFEIQPATLAIPSIAKGTMYIKPLRMTLGRYPVKIELKPGLFIINALEEDIYPISKSANIISRTYQ